MMDMFKIQILVGMPAYEEGVHETWWSDAARDHPQINAAYPTREEAIAAIALIPEPHGATRVVEVKGR